MFNSFLTDVMPLDLAIPIAINFLFEGVKVLFRYVIGALALNRDFILQVESKKDFKQQMQLNSAAMDIDELQQLAFSVQIRTQGSMGNQVKFLGLDQSEIKKKLSKRLKKGKADQAILNADLYSDKLYLIPYYSLNSKIIEFKQWAKLWSSLPTYVGIR